MAEKRSGKVRTTAEPSLPPTTEVFKVPDPPRRTSSKDDFGELDGSLGSTLVNESVTSWFNTTAGTS